LPTGSNGSTAATPFGRGSQAGADQRLRGETETIEKMAGRVEHDLWYLDNWSFFLDCKIVLLTMFFAAGMDREAR